MLCQRPLLPGSRAGMTAAYKMAEVSERSIPVKPQGAGHALLDASIPHLVVCFSGSHLAYEAVTLASTLGD